MSKENEVKRWNGLTGSCYDNVDDDNGENIMMWLLILLWGEPFYVNVSLSLFNMFIMRIVFHLECLLTFLLLMLNCEFFFDERKRQFSV